VRFSINREPAVALQNSHHELVALAEKVFQSLSSNRSGAALLFGNTAAVKKRITPNFSHRSAGASGRGRRARPSEPRDENDEDRTARAVASWYPIYPERHTCPISKTCWRTSSAKSRRLAITSGRWGDHREASGRGPQARRRHAEMIRQRSRAIERCLTMDCRQAARTGRHHD